VRILKLNPSGEQVWMKELGVARGINKMGVKKEYSKMVLKEEWLYLGASEHLFVEKDGKECSYFDYSYVMCLDLDGNIIWKKILDEFDLSRVCFLDVTNSEIIVLGSSDPTLFSNPLDKGRTFQLPSIEGSKKEENGCLLAMKLDRETGKLQNYHHGFCSIKDYDCIQKIPEGYLAWTAYDEPEIIYSYTYISTLPTYLLKIREDLSMEKISEKNHKFGTNQIGTLVPDGNKFYAVVYKGKWPMRYESFIMEISQDFKVIQSSEPKARKIEEKLKIQMVDDEYIWILGDVVSDIRGMDTNVVLMRMKKSDFGKKREK